MAHQRRDARAGELLEKIIGIMEVVSVYLGGQLPGDGGHRRALMVWLRS